MILVEFDFIKLTWVCYPCSDMFDMRYHIASLVAVFLALTVGLLLGSLLMDKGLLADEQERLLNSIRVDVDKISEKNRSLQSEVGELRDFQKQVLPIAIKDRLSETSVTIMTLVDGQEKLVNEIEKSLILAGASATRLHVDLRGINVASGGLLELQRELAADEGISDREAERSFWPRVTAEIAGAESPLLLGALLDEGLVTIEMPDTLIDNLVVIAASDRGIGSRDIVFLDAFSEVDGVRVIAVESSEARPSRIAAYKLRNVSTIDNVETAPGKISLVHLLSERDLTAHFGVKAAADRPMP